MEERKPFICPNCKAEIYEVTAITDGYQYPDINENGEIIEWGVIEEVDGDSKFYCQECEADITSYIKE